MRTLRGIALARLPLLALVPVAALVLALGSNPLLRLRALHLRKPLQVAVLRYGVLPRTQHATGASQQRAGTGSGAGRAVPAQWPERRRPTRLRSPSPPQPAPGTRRAAAAGAASRRTGSLWRQGAEGARSAAGRARAGRTSETAQAPEAALGVRQHDARHVRALAVAPLGHAEEHVVVDLLQRAGLHAGQLVLRCGSAGSGAAARGARVAGAGPGSTWKFQKWALTKLAWPPSDTVMTSRIVGLARGGGGVG